MRFAYWTTKATATHWNK